MLYHLDHYKGIYVEPQLEKYRLRLHTLCYKILRKIEMLLFSEYLEKNHIDRACFTDKEKKNYHLIYWLQTVFVALKPSTVYLPDVAKSLEVAARKEFSCYLSSYWQSHEIDKTIEEIEGLMSLLYFALIYYSKAKSMKTPMKPNLLYPYNSRHAGVSMSAYIVVGTHQSSTIFGEKVWQSHDALQHKALGGNINATYLDINSNLGTSELSSDLKNLITNRCKERQFHAEDHWFSLHMKEVIKYLKAQVNMEQLVLPKEPLDDDIWLAQLFTFPRIEFVMTSSSCEACQAFFSHFRTLLNKKKLFLPIVIYASSPFNANEASTSPVVLVKFNTNYFFTQFTAEMPYYMKRKQQISSALLVHGIFSRQERDFTQLENIVNTAMPKVINAPPRLQRYFIDEIMFMMCSSKTLNQTTYYWFLNFLERFKAVTNKKHFEQLTWDNRPDEDYDTAVKRLFGSPKGKGEDPEYIERALERTVNFYFKTDYADKELWLPPHELGLKYKEYYQAYHCKCEIQKDTLPFTISFSGTKRYPEQETIKMEYFVKVISVFLSQLPDFDADYDEDSQVKIIYSDISIQTFNQIILDTEWLFEQYCLPSDEMAQRMTKHS